MFQVETYLCPVKNTPIICIFLPPFLLFFVHYSSRYETRISTLLYDFSITKIIKLVF